MRRLGSAASQLPGYVLSRAVIVASVIFSAAVSAQQPATAHDHRLFACRTDDLAKGDSSGCDLVAQPKVAGLGSGPVFWHLTTFASRHDAQAASRPTDAIVETEG